MIFERDYDPGLSVIISGFGVTSQTPPYHPQVPRVSFFLKTPTLSSKVEVKSKENDKKVYYNEKPKRRFGLTRAGTEMKKERGRNKRLNDFFNS